MHHDGVGTALVGTTDIALMLGVSRQRVGQLVESIHDFPPPVDTVARQRVWYRTDIEQWIAAHPARRPGRPSKKAGQSRAG